MPSFERGPTTIYFEQHGQGFPLLAIAPGGMNSSVEMWQRAAINPLDDFAGEFRLIAMDQRNAGRSTGPLDLEDPWGSFVEDQLALLDHLGIDEFLVLGCCIGGSYILKLIERAPERVIAAVLEQPIGLIDENVHLFEELWRSWGAALLPQRSDIDRDTIERFGARMWGGGEFVVSVTRESVRACPTPLLVLPGIDEYHPTATGREIAALAPHAEVVEPWKDTPEHVAHAVGEVRRFLVTHALSATA
jgi:pimeloyl-ACP methyl ester carboxylesterase